MRERQREDNAKRRKEWGTTEVMEGVYGRKRKKKENKKGNDGGIKRK